MCRTFVYTIVPEFVSAPMLFLLLLFICHSFLANVSDSLGTFVNAEQHVILTPSALIKTPNRTEMFAEKIIE